MWNQMWSQHVNALDLGRDLKFGSNNDKILASALLTYHLIKLNGIQLA